MNRRTIGVALVTILLMTSGCLELVTGGTATFEASQATVSDETLEQTDYSLDEKTTQNITRNFSAAGQERTVKVTNHLAQYHRAISLGPLGEKDLARFVVLSTPAVEIAGQTFNPVGDWSEERIVNRLSSQYSGLSDVSHVNNRSVKALGEQRSISKFTGRATIAAGQEIDVVIHVTKFKHGDDFVVAVGIHPEKLPDEQQRVNDLIRGVQHDSNE